MTIISLVIRKNELNLQVEGLKPVEGPIFILTNLACDVAEAVDIVVL